MDWFKTAHGISTDPKWLVIARNAVTLPCVAFATWMSLLDYASQNRVRGSIEGFDAESAGAFLGIDQETIEKVIAAFKAKGMIDGNSLIAKWNERQNKASDSAERVKRYRERKRNAVTLQPAHVHAVTAEEKRREESKERKPLSGKPDEKPPEVQILAYLNERTGCAFRPVESSLRLVRARLGEGASPEDCKAVVDAKVAEWTGNAEMAKYLRPGTLFAAKNFANYVGQLATAKAKGGAPWWAARGFGTREEAIAAGEGEVAA